MRRGRNRSTIACEGAPQATRIVTRIVSLRPRSFSLRATRLSRQGMCRRRCACTSGPDLAACSSRLCSMPCVERVAACNIANTPRTRQLRAICGGHSQSHCRKGGTGGLDCQAAIELDAALVSVCTHLFDQGEKATSYTGTALVSYTRALGYGRRILDDGQRRKAERVAYNNVANCLQRLGQYSAAVRLRKRCLKSCVADRDARLAETSRNNLYIALLSEAAERYGMAPRPSLGMRCGRTRRGTRCGAERGGCGQRARSRPHPQGDRRRFFGRPTCRSMPFCSGVHQVREAAVEGAGNCQRCTRLLPCVHLPRSPT